MKKRMALLLATALIASLTACGGSKPAEPASTVAATTAAATAGEKKEADAPAADKTAAGTDNVEWPKGKVDIIVPGAAGSNQDLSVRIQIEYWEKLFPDAKFNVINEKTGAGTLAMEMCRTAKNDGSTLLFTGSGSNIMYHQGKYQYDVLDEEQFTIIAPTAGGNGMGSILLTQPDKPYNNLEEFVAYCKEHPGEVTVGTSTGTTQEIKIKLLMQEYDLDVKYVVASGNDTITALLAGNLDVALQSSNKAAGYIEAGDLKGIVNNTAQTKEDVAKEFPVLADIDTYETLGLTDIVFRAPMYLIGPGKMDEALVQKINESICVTADDAESQERWGAMASLLVPRDVETIREEVRSLDADVAQIYQ